MTREYPERPIVGVGAVIFDRDRVLLVQRGHAPMQGEWSLPGGALELGETLEEGVKREVQEETGLIVEPMGMVAVFDRIARDDAGRVQFHYVLVDYLCRISGGSAACASDAVDLRWSTREELDSIAPFTRNVILKAWAISHSA
ncbi:MAG TPA: NUDIX hydrolase [Silvibacterium sp.]|nr:NUDIX hydrolase [Silvibacterium sp.]